MEQNREAAGMLSELVVEWAKKIYHATDDLHKEACEVGEQHLFLSGVLSMLVQSMDKAMGSEKTAALFYQLAKQLENGDTSGQLTNHLDG
jgi:hypothetical protein